MIIVEGPDGSGKSTFIEALGLTASKVRALRGGQGGTNADGQCDVTASGWGGDQEATVAYARGLHARMDQEQAAYDRYHLSEVVYGPMLRDKSGIDGNELRVLRRLLYARGIPTVVCLPPFAVTRKNVETPGRERPAFQTPEFLWTAYQRWSTVAFAGQDANVIVYDYRQEPDARAWYGRHRIPASREIGNPTAVGSPSARYLIVGEQSNLAVDLPFFSMRASSGYLNRTLWEAGFREAEMCFINALDAKGRPNPIRNLPLTITDVICLGKVAEEAIHAHRDKALKVHALPHPQFWKRFHSRQLNDYTLRLQQLRRRSSSAVAA